MAPELPPYGRFRGDGPHSEIVSSNRHLGGQAASVSFRPGKEVTNVDTTMTIQGFNTLLASQDETPLLKVLRQLTTLKRTEDVRVLAVDPQLSWQGWCAPPE